MLFRFVFLVISLISFVRAMQSPVMSTGFKIARTPWLNKGSSFTHQERKSLGIQGLVPAGEPLSLDDKVEMAMAQLAKKSSGIEKYTYLHTIQDSDETLFYAILSRHTYDIMPYVYTPTVGQACLDWNTITRQTPRGLYLSMKDAGNIRNVLNNYPLKDIKVIVITDGERILGLGDQGVNGMGIPIGKLALYTACAGIHPNQCLPVQIDVGTNNKKLLGDKTYLGLKQNRVRGEKYHALLEEFFTASKDAYGKNVLIQFEDFGNENAFDLLSKFRNQATCFNDDIQGTASVVLAGILSTLKLTKKDSLKDHKFLFYGAGEAGVGIADLVAEAMVKSSGISLEQAKSRIWLVDSKGLISQDRVNSGEKLAHHKLSYAHPLTEEMRSQLKSAVSSNDKDKVLFSALQAVKPSGLIGVSAQGQAFSQKICKSMASMNERPLIFALSNPTSKAECTAQEAYEWTDGKCVFASGSPFDPVTLPDGRNFIPGQGNNAYIFPGVGLAALATGATSITDNDFYIAAASLASQTSEERLAQGCAYPPLENIREVSANIAADVAKGIFETGRASLPAPSDILSHCKSLMYEPKYENIQISATSQ